MERIIRIIEAVTATIGGVAAILVIPLIVATVWEVFARYVYGAPTIWAFELGYTLMGLHFLLGGALTLKQQVHVRIDLVYARLSDRGRAWNDLVLYLLCVLPSLILIVIRFSEHTISALQSGETSGQSAWNPPIWPFRAVIVSSLALLTLQVIAECLKCVTAIRGRTVYPRK